MADAIMSLVKNIVDTEFDNLPTEAVDAAKKSILDTLAVSVAGSTAAGCKEVVDLVKEYGGSKESTIWVYGGKVPASLAGLANGPMARAWDFGDVHEKGGYHLGETIVPATLPMAERQGNVTGRDFITAVALGQDLMGRIGKCIASERMMPTGHAFRIFGAAAAVGKLLRLGEDEMTNAMGIAYSHMFVEKQGYKDGALTPRLQHGFVADGAIRSCLLAQKGVSGPTNILQGEYGYFVTCESARDIGALTYELGKIFEGAQVCLKPYACCQFAHGAITATLELLEEYNIRAEDVQQVHVGLSPKAYNFTCEPEEVKANPRNIIDAQFSAYYTVAVAVLERDVFIEHFTQEMIRCPEVRQTMKKVKPEIELELKESDLAQGAVVTIKTTSGQKYTRKVYYTKGHPKNPMTMDEVRAKFRRCVPFSARPLHMKNAERIIAMVRNLEEVSDVSEIAGLLVP